MSDYFPLLDLPKEILELIAVQSGASGYFLRFVCKGLLHIRPDLFNRTRTVLLEGNLDLFNLLPDNTSIKFSYAVQSNSLRIISSYLTRCQEGPVPAKTHHIKSTEMIRYLKDKKIHVRNTGRYHSLELRDELISSGLIENREYVS